MLKVGLIGRGNISKAHTAAYDKIYAENERAKIVACCDICPQNMEDLPDARHYTDIDTFLKEEQGKLDYVDICLPTYLHAEVAIKAMRMGFDVLSEKPMARTHALAQEMCRVAKETGRRLMVGQCNRFIGAVSVVKNTVADGSMGKVRNAEFTREGGGAPLGYQNWFRDEALSGGGLLDLHVHDIDLIQYIFGTPKAVSVMGQNVNPGAGYDIVFANYRFDDFIVSARCDWTIVHDFHATRVLRVNFEKGYLYLDRTDGKQTFVKVDEDGTVTDLWELAKTDLFYNELCYFMDALEGKTPFAECVPESCAESIRIAEAEKQSADLNGGVVLC